MNYTAFTYISFRSINIQIYVFVKSITPSVRSTVLRRCLYTSLLEDDHGVAHGFFHTLYLEQMEVEYDVVLTFHFLGKSHAVTCQHAKTFYTIVLQA